MVDETRGYLAEGIAAPYGEVVSCWMCGTRLDSSQMVPDGGIACDDVRWYCKDPEACTERWTSARRQMRAAGTLPPEGAPAVGFTRQARL
jgi:hypothetical protein